MRKQFRREPVEQVRKTNLQVRSSAAGKREFTRMAGDLPSPDASIIYKGHKRSRRPSTPRSSAGNKKSYFSFFFFKQRFHHTASPKCPKSGTSRTTGARIRSRCLSGDGKTVLTILRTGRSCQRENRAAAGARGLLRPASDDGTVPYPRGLGCKRGVVPLVPASVAGAAMRALAFFF